MRNPKHIQSACQKEAWKRVHDKVESLRKGDFRDAALFDDLLATFKEYRKSGQDLPWQSIFIGEYRYWLDGKPSDAEAIFREKVEARSLESRDLTRFLRMMVKHLEEMPDNSTFCTDDLLGKCIQHFCTYNLGLGPSFEYIDGVYYLPYGNGRSISESLEWEMEDRFKAAAERHGFMIDSADSAFKALGLPYNIPCTYRRKSNLLRKVEKFIDEDAVRDDEGRLMYYSKAWKTKDGCELMLLSVPAGAPEVMLLTGDLCCQVEIISGQAELKSRHQVFTTVYGESEPRWIDTGETRKCNGKGRIFCEPDYGDETVPVKSFFTVRNIGDSPAIVIISKETPCNEIL